MQVQGAITTITSKEIFTGKMKRAANIYSFKVTGDDNWYKTGFEALKATEGDEVSFDASQTQYGWNVDATAIRVLGRAEVPTVTTINKTTAGSMTKDDYWKNREDRDQTVQRTIQYQSARNSSIATVSAALAAGILTIPKRKVSNSMRSLCRWIS